MNKGSIITIESKETRSRSCISQQWLIYVIITSHHSWVQYKY